VLIVIGAILPAGVGRMKSKTKFGQVFSRVASINWLAGARLMLFASRDVWFVVGLPVFLYDQLGWGFVQVGTFLALWVIGYGFVQAAAPKLTGAGLPNRRLVRFAFALTAIPALIALGLDSALRADAVVVGGLLVFGIAFALNSALHSYLILAYADHDKVAMNVGFYYMANAAGRLLGTLLSGALYQYAGLTACLWMAALLSGVAALASLNLPAPESVKKSAQADRPADALLKR